MKGQAKPGATDSGRCEFLSDDGVKPEVATAPTTELLRNLYPEKALGPRCFKQGSWGNARHLPFHVIRRDLTGDEGLHRIAKLFVVLGVQRAFHKPSA